MWGIKRDATDAALSDFIRTKANFVCEHCLRDFIDNKQAIHCSHFIGRGNKAVRWDIDNVAALCFGCHRKFTENPVAHYDFFMHRLGKQRFERLIIRSHQTFKEMNIDEKALRISLREMTKNLNSKVIGLRQ